MGQDSCVAQFDTEFARYKWPQAYTVSSIPCLKEILRDSVSKMKAAGPSGVVSESVQAPGRGAYSERKNYTGQKLTDQILKKAERITEKLIGQQVENDDAVWFYAKMQTNTQKKNENCVFAFVDLLKTFD